MVSPSHSARAHRQCGILRCRGTGRGGGGRFRGTCGVGRRRRSCSCGWGEVGDAGVADGDGRARMLERVFGIVQEVQRQRQLVVRLRNAPVIRLFQRGEK